MLKDQQPINEIGAEQDKLDQMRSKVNKVGAALGYHAFDLSNEQILALGQKISEIEEVLSDRSKDDEFPDSPHGSALNLEFALQVQNCIQSLPINTELGDLSQWRMKPLANPNRTSLMLHSTRAQRREMGTILGHLVRSTPDPLDLKTITDNFAVDRIFGLSINRRLFFNIAFQEMDIPEELLEGHNIDPDNLEGTVLRTVRRRRPAKHERGTHQIGMPLFPVTEKARKNVRIEEELWQYADENNLLPQIARLRILSSQELEEVVNYFTGKSRMRRGRRWAAIFDKFSIAVARLT